MDTNFCYGQIPNSRATSSEAHEMTCRRGRQEPFALDGEIHQLRGQCWPKPIQKRTPIYIPGGGSIEKWDSARLRHTTRNCLLGYLRGSRYSTVLERVPSAARENRLTGPSRADHLVATRRRAEGSYAEQARLLLNGACNLPQFRGSTGYRTMATVEIWRLSQLTQAPQEILENSREEVVEGDS